MHVAIIFPFLKLKFNAIIFRETILHTLRVVIIPAGDRMSDQVRRSLFMMLRDMIGHSEDVIRSTAAASLACLMRWLSSEQLNAVLTEHILSWCKTVFMKQLFIYELFKFFLIMKSWFKNIKKHIHRIVTSIFTVDDTSIDSTLRHGRSTTLFVALKENASYVYTSSYSEKINRTLISHLQASKVC